VGHLNRRLGTLSRRPLHSMEAFPDVQPGTWAPATAERDTGLCAAAVVSRRRGSMWVLVLVAGCPDSLKLASLRPVRPSSVDAHVVASRNLSENFVSDPAYEANYRTGLHLSGRVPIEDRHPGRCGRPVTICFSRGRSWHRVSRKTCPQRFSMTGPYPAQRGMLINTPSPPRLRLAGWCRPFGVAARRRRSGGFTVRTKAVTRWVGSPRGQNGSVATKAYS